MRVLFMVCSLLLLFSLNGCVATKIVTTPMRAAGEVIGFVPLVGDVVEGAIDTTAGAVDLVPL